MIAKALAWAAVAVSTACSGERAPASRATAAQEAAGMERTPDASDLPYAQGRSFATLDDYLAFRRERGAIDLPWYREARPGVYELVTRRGPGAPPKTFTRAELMRRYGFTR